MKTEDIIKINKIQRELAGTFEELLKEYGDTPEIRLKIAEYTMGYMGASYGLHVK